MVRIPRTVSRLRGPAALLLVVAAAVRPAPAQERAAAVDGPLPAEAASSASAAVLVDGEDLFRIRGASALPAEQRAREIARRIVAAARDPQVSPDSLRIVPVELGLDLVAGRHRLLTILNADAQLEQMATREFAAACQMRIAQTIRNYRADRDPDRVLRRAGLVLGVGVALVLILAGFVRVTRRGERWLTARCQIAAASVQARTFELVRADRIWWVLRGVTRFVRGLVVVLVVYLYLNWGLALFPWTRLAGRTLLDLVADPVRTVVAAFVGYLPELFFLIILAWIARWTLRLVATFFAAVERGSIVLRDFDPEWTQPTHQIVRFLLVALFIVVAYPYIPGSDSGAFKGVSLLLGFLVSLGSSTVIANFIAGYTMIYRRAFRLGDRIRIGDYLGDVTARRPLAVTLRTPKNEEVVIPNAEILSSPVVNYSTLVREGGLILHTTVGIGYEVPWRQVEAMLLLAAARTEGLLSDRPAFVLQQTLGDFCVQYELNVYCGSAQQMGPLYSAQHRNIQDVFNEYGGQIMTPAYEGDPERPKIVPPERWHAAPAVPPERA